MFLMLSSPVRADSDSAFLQSANLAGTDGRTELEFKLAFEVDDTVSVDEIGELVRRGIAKAFMTEEFEFEKLMGRRYELDREFKAFLFRDVYMDTPDFDLLKRGSVYRVRHRWSRYEAYLRHKLFPFIRSFYPSRCEIQFKTGYQPDFERNVVSPVETRFEFRNESAPFDEKQDAPRAPWPVDEYVEYAKNGKYRDYRMKPMAELLKVLEIEDSQPPALHPVVTIMTVRDRIHLNMKHPWGSGPNPEQVFIITLDKTTVGDAHGRDAPKTSVLEFEIEIERNTSTEIHATMELDKIDDLRFGAVKDAAVDHSKAAWRALLSDLEVLRQVLAKEVNVMKGARPLPLNFKYARVMGMILEENPTASKSDDSKQF